MGLQVFLRDTWLIERLFGVGLYCLVLLVVCDGIAVSRPSAIKKWLIFRLTVTVGMNAADAAGVGCGSSLRSQSLMPFRRVLA